MDVSRNFYDKFRLLFPTGGRQPSYVNEDKFKRPFGFLVFVYRWLRLSAPEQLDQRRLSVGYLELWSSIWWRSELWLFQHKINDRGFFVFRLFTMKVHQAIELYYFDVLDFSNGITDWQFALWWQYYLLLLLYLYLFVSFQLSALLSNYVIKLVSFLIFQKWRIK